MISAFWANLLYRSPCLHLFGVDAYPTKVQFWQKKSHNEDWQPQRYRPEMILDVTDFSDTMVDKVREVIVAAAQTELRSKKEG